jgi:hypothetical protein
VTNIPNTGEPENSDPHKRAKAIARSAARKAAAISGTLALPPGPFGLATVLPDILAIWHIQRAMVADIAGAFGKSAFLEKETMMYCLFKHGGAALMSDVVSRVGERFIVQRASLKMIQLVLQKIGIRVTQRAIGSSITKWMPLIGALGVGAYAYYDTTKVAASAIELFSSELFVEGESGPSVTI